MPPWLHDTWMHIFLYSIIHSTGLISWMKEKQFSWLLTVCPIPSTCMVALCTKSKPWPVTVIVLPPLRHTHTKCVKFVLICKYLRVLYQDKKETGGSIIMQNSLPAVEIRTRHQRHAATLVHTYCAFWNTIDWKRCTSGWHTIRTYVSDSRRRTAESFIMVWI